MTRNPVVRHILVSKQPRDEYVRYVMKSVCGLLKKSHGSVNAELERSGEDIHTRWKINDREVCVTLKSDVLESIRYEPFVLDDMFLEEFKRHDVRLGDMDEKNG